MRSLVKLTAYSMIVALAAALILSCEDSALLAPTDGIFTVSASPETIVIDEPGGDSCGTATIAAQIFDSGNYPMQGVEIIFTADGGTLLESDPADIDTDCGVTAENAGNSTLALETDVRGMAVVYLTITLDDAVETTVTARSGTISESAVVTLSITPENQLPEAFISVQPEDNALFNQSILFDGRGSADPDGDDITCYKWMISSNLIGVAPEVIQGHGKSVFLRRYNVEQQLDVELRVSDDPDYANFCTECEGAPAACGANNSYFGSPDFIVGYGIVCDPTDPIANAGPDKTVTLGAGQTTITVELNGSASQDPESSQLQFEWDCANGQTFDTAIARCNYTAGTWTASLIVTNDCGKTDFDSAVVTVNAP